MIQPVKDGPEKFRNYGLFAEVLIKCSDSSEQSNVEAAQLVVANLQTVQIESVLKVRDVRLQWVASIVKQAALAQRSAAETTPARPRIPRVSISAERGGVSLQVPELLLRPIAAQDDAEANRWLTLAAFFREPPEGPDFPRAAAVSDRLINVPDPASVPDPLLLLINARAHQANGETQDESLVTAMHSYGRLADQYRRRPWSDTWVMTADEFYQLVLKESLTYFFQFPVWKKRVEELLLAPDQWRTLDDSIRDVLKDVARLEATRGRILKNAPQFIDSIAGDASLPTDEHILEIFERASVLDPENADYVIERGLMVLRESRPPKDELDTLQEITGKAREINVQHVGLDILDGRCQLLRARLAKDRHEKQPELRAAIQSFQTALNRFGERPDKTAKAAADEVVSDVVSIEKYRFYALLGFADANVQLANTVDAVDTETIRRSLKDAVAAAEEAENLKQERSQVLLVWSNALEDETWLLKRTDSYVAAIEKFLEARKAAKQNNRQVDESNACLSIGRCVYRHLLENEREKSVSVRDGKQITNIDLETAVTQYLFEGNKLATEVDALRAENYVYQAKIRRLQAVRENTSEKQLNHLKEAHECYMNCVELAGKSKIPELSEYQIQWAQNCVDLWWKCQENQYKEKVDSLINEFLGSLPTGPGQLLRKDGNTALACIQIWMSVQKEPDWLLPHVNRILTSLADPGTKIHLHLLQAQYEFEAATDLQSWNSVRKAVLGSLEDARKVASGGNHAGQLDLWTARIDGQAAPSQERSTSGHPPRARHDGTRDSRHSTSSLRPSRRSKDPAGPKPPVI